MSPKYTFSFTLLLSAKFYWDSSGNNFYYSCCLYVQPLCFSALDLDRAWSLIAGISYTLWVRNSHNSQKKWGNGYEGEKKKKRMWNN